MENLKTNISKKIDKYIKLNNLTYRGAVICGLGDFSWALKNGSTRLNKLFKIAIYFGVDIRNFFISDNCTYIFKDSYTSYEEFLSYLGDKFRCYRIDRGLRAIDIDKDIPSIYQFENGKTSISIKKISKYFEKLDVTPDDFFKSDIFKVINDSNLHLNLTKEDIFNRISELEKMRNIKIAESVIPTKTVMPTLHVFFNICKSLKVSPDDFFRFDEIDLEFKKLNINNREIINEIKSIINTRTEGTQKFLRLDNIINYCNTYNISIIDFFKDLIDGNKHQISELMQ